MGAQLVGFGMVLVIFVSMIALGCLMSWTLSKPWAGKFWASAITITGIVGIVLIGIGSCVDY